MFEHISDIDWARAAAYLDGEGSIYIAKGHGRQTLSGHQLCLDVTNTDPRLPIWFRERFGGTVSIHSKKTNKNSRQAFRWRARCNIAANVLEGFLPYFLLKRDQAEMAIAFQQQFTTGRGGRAQKVTQEEFLERDKYRVLLSEAKWKEHEWPGSLLVN